MSDKEKSLEKLENLIKKISLWPAVTRNELKYRYIAFFLIGVVGGAFVSGFWHAIVIMPQVGTTNVLLGDNNDDNDTTITVTVTLPNGNTTTITTTDTTTPTTTPITTTVPPPPINHFELLEYQSPPHPRPDEYWIYGNIDPTTIFFNVTVAETDYRDGTVYLYCYVQIHTGSRQWYVSASMIANEVRELQFTFVVSIDFSNAIEWGFSYIRIIGSD